MRAPSAQCEQRIITNHCFNFIIRIEENFERNKNEMIFVFISFFLVFQFKTLFRCFCFGLEEKANRKVFNWIMNSVATTFSFDFLFSFWKIRHEFFYPLLTRNLISRKFRKLNWLPQLKSTQRSKDVLLALLKW